MERLQSVKFKESVRLNMIENYSYKNDRVEIYLDGIVIKLIDKPSGDHICSTLMNVISFKQLPDEDVDHLKSE